MAIESFGEHTPQLNSPSFIATSADIIGQVTLAPGCNVWYNTTIRGDVSPIEIGEGSNVQDNCVIHVDASHPCRIGDDVTVGHGAILHGCTVGDHCVIGMGAIVLNGAVLGEHCLVGAGAVVTGKMDAPAGSLILGNPAKVVKPLSQEQLDYIQADAQLYITLAKAQLPRHGE